MEIKAHSKNYKVIFETGFEFIRTLAAIDQSFWVIDKHVYELYNREMKQSVSQERILVIESTENNKTIETALEICERMTVLPAKRNSVLISVGGGIIQDITGFAANILYRGIPWIFIPTTLLAACDSCIGSKTSLNYKKFKNLLGTFYPPDELHICHEFFKTLSLKDYLSGLGEVVKFNIMAGPAELSVLQMDMPELLQRNNSFVMKYIHKALEFKKTFIEADEYDRGIRIHLNFAHTFGHAFETVTNYAIPHGTAVALGTIAANNISYNRGWINADTKKSIQEILLRIINIHLLEKENHLNIDDIYKIDGIMHAISKDKKQVNDSVTAVLFQNDDLQLKIIHDLTRREVETAIYELTKVL